MSGMDIVLGLCISILCICGVSMAMIIRRLAEKVKELDEREIVDKVWALECLDHHWCTTNRSLEEMERRLAHWELVIGNRVHPRPQEYKCEFSKEKKENGNTD